MVSRRSLTCIFNVLNWTHTKVTLSRFYDKIEQKQTNKQTEKKSLNKFGLWYECGISIKTCVNCKSDVKSGKNFYVMNKQRNQL